MVSKALNSLQPIAMRALAGGAKYVTTDGEPWSQPGQVLAADALNVPTSLAASKSGVPVSPLEQLIC